DRGAGTGLLLLLVVLVVHLGAEPRRDVGGVVLLFRLVLGALRGFLIFDHRFPFGSGAPTPGVATPPPSESSQSQVDGVQISLPLYAVRRDPQSEPGEHQ